MTRLIGVIDRAIDSVAKAELAREVYDKSTGRELILRFLDGGDQPAAIAAGQHVRDLVLEVEAFSED
jgi:hypothetical protein